MRQIAVEMAAHLDGPDLRHSGWLQATVDFETGVNRPIEALSNLPIFAPMGFRAFDRASLTTDVSGLANRLLAELDGYGPPKSPEEEDWHRRNRALVAAVIGDPDLAQDNYQYVIESPVRIDAATGSAARLAGRLALVLGRSEDAEALFDDAIDFCEASGFLPELALAHYNQAQLLRDRGGSGDSERADDLALKGRDLAARLGMVSIATLFDEFRSGEPTESLLERPGGLTDRELEVLELIAIGNTNSEIAKKLVISPYTVVRHATRIYAKIGVSNRTEAAAFAASQGLTNTRSSSRT